VYENVYSTIDILIYFYTIPSLSIIIQGSLMVQEIITYPDQRINVVSADVRFFDEELWELIEDMKETAEHHQVDGLAAIQLAIPLSVVVAKDPEGNWHEFISPRIIKRGKTVSVRESTLYMPDVTESVPRYDWIKFVYQDREGKQHAMEAEGAFGYLLQRKFDYVFGGTFTNKLDKKKRKEIEKELAETTGVAAEFNACPTMSKREYFKSAMNKLLFFEALSLTAPLFHASTDTLSSLYTYGVYATIAVMLLIVGYLIYSKWEASIYTSCTGCQVASFSAVALKYFVAAMILFAGSYYLLKPV